MDGKLFRECAMRLKESATADEADFRSSISRYYYSSFHQCISLDGLAFTGLSTTESKHLNLFTTHRKLIYSLENRALNPKNQGILKLVGNKLGLILQSRSEADYELAQVIGKAQANCASNHCRDIVTLLNQIVA